jgi:hypothetical protein
MALILFLGFGFAALRNADEFWASATYTLAIISILVALLGAFARKGKARMTWAGTAVFGWVYFLIHLLPDRRIGGLGTGPIPWPSLLSEWGAAQLVPHVSPGTNWLEYDQVSHSLGIIVFGLVGAVLGRLLAVKDDRANP